MKAIQIMSGEHKGTIIWGNINHILFTPEPKAITGGVVLVSKTFDEGHVITEEESVMLHGSKYREVKIDDGKPRIEGGQHCNANILTRETLLDAIENPDKYPQLTIRVSGYAVRVNSLTREQQMDIVTRTFTTHM